MFIVKGNCSILFNYLKHKSDLLTPLMTFDLAENLNIFVTLKCVVPNQILTFYHVYFSSNEFLKL